DIRSSVGCTESRCPFENGAGDTPARFTCCCAWCTENGRLQTHQRPHSRPFIVKSCRTTTRGCGICVDCVRRRAPSARHMHCGSWLHSGPRAEQESLARLSVRDIDAYLMECCPGLRRA